MVTLGCCIPYGDFIAPENCSAPITEAEQFIAKCRFIHDIGYDFAECSAYAVATMAEDDFQAIVEENKKNPLGVYAANCLFAATYSLSDPGEHWEDIMAYVRHVVDRLSLLGVRYVVFGSGGARKIQETTKREDGLHNLRRLMGAFADYAEPKGITMVLEPLRSQESNVYNQVPECDKEITLIGRNGVRLLADTFHMLMENTPSEVVADCAENLRHCHISEGPDRLPPGFITTGDPAYNQRFANALNRIGYSYGVSVECTFQDFKSQSPQALAYLRSIFTISE